MEWFPHGKVNLSLYITGKRADGYHLVDTIYWPLPLYDYLRLEPSETPRLTSPVSALESPDNLVLKAWQLMLRAAIVQIFRIGSQREEAGYQRSRMG